MTVDATPLRERRTWPAPATVLELLKPITWFAPMWAFACGLVSANVPFSETKIWPLIGGVLLAGPLVTGMSQAANDWFDRHVDAINEPDRPVPSGRMPGRSALYLALVWTALSLLVAWSIGPAVLGAALLGVVLAWAYSAPPLRLKKNGWLGNAACGFAYEGLPWFTGAAVMLGGMPSVPIILLAFLYSFGAHGIMTLNDFKSEEGDAAIGIRSLPVLLGTDNAARLACIMMALPQAVVIALLALWSRPLEALAIAALLMAQFFLMKRLLAAPRAEAARYNATGTSLYVLGMMIAAIALRSASL